MGRPDVLLPGERLGHLIGEEHAVGEAGERVVVGLVAELLLQIGHLRERLLEPAVLEQDAGVAGEGLEQLAFGLGERADVAGAVADDQEPERALLAAERADDRVAQPALGEEPVERMGVAAASDQ